MVKATRALALLAVVALAAGCSVKETTTPPLTGPSELSLSMTITAAPDTISRDGTSQSLVAVLARDASGRAVASLPLRLDVLVNGQVMDFGLLSTKSVVTGSDGRASVVYTSPAPPADSANASTTVVSILATPVGSNYANASPRSVDIRVVPTGISLPPGSGPAAKFSVAWTASPGVGVPAVFNAAESSSPAGVVGYAWDFGDGTAAGSGVAVQHTFAVAGTYSVRLTITDAKGLTAWTTQSVVVVPGPTASFTFTPTSPTVGTIVQFDASASWSIPPSSIVTYKWDFGDGNPPISGVNAIVATIYGTAKTYTVTLTVTDGNGLSGWITKTVTVR
jgi:PKD repeat protein